MACVLLYEMEINPVAFADWATSEDVVCEAGDWLGGAWSGLKGGLAGGWDELMRGGVGGFFGGFRKGWRSSRDTKYDQYDIQAIDDAMKHFQDLTNRLSGSEHADLNAKMAQLIDNLKKASAEKPPIVEPEEGSNEPVMPEEDPKVLEVMKNYKGPAAAIKRLQPVWDKLPTLVKREFAVELQKVIQVGVGFGKRVLKNIGSLLTKHQEIIDKLNPTPDKASDNPGDVPNPS
jgi:hypothetical protein